MSKSVKMYNSVYLWTILLKKLNFVLYKDGR